MLNELDVSQYFRAIEGGGFSESWECEVNLLGSAAARDLTRKFQGHPLIEKLDGLVLDDPNTSDHHVLLRSPCVAGQVLYLAHDGESRVVFSSLQELLANAERAQREDIPLPELHPAAAPLGLDQPELAAFIRRLVASELIDVALSLVPSLDLSDHDLLEDLVAHEDFFLGEAVAEAIRARPSRALLPMAMRCAGHAHQQVARAGRLASDACSI